MLLLFAIYVNTNGQPYITDEGEQAAVAGTFQQILMAPIAGFHNAGRRGFVFCLGAFLAWLMQPVLETGIHVLVKAQTGTRPCVGFLMFLVLGRRNNLRHG